LEGVNGTHYSGWCTCIDNYIVICPYICLFTINLSMRKHYTNSGPLRRLLQFSAFALLLMCSSSVFGQLPYTRTIFNAAYTPITVGGGATLTTIAGDDGTQTLLPIGFTFTYNGTPFTTVDACANGWISFGASGANNWTNSALFSATTPNNTLAPWWDDLNVGTGAVLYQTQGVAPNRTFTVQWDNVLSYNGSTRTINFQAVLVETSNVIEFRYGIYNGAAFSASESASIGIESATGGAGQFLDCVSGSAFINQSFMNTTKWPTYNIRLTPGAPPVLPGGSYTVGTTGFFPNLHEAIIALNHAGISGSVILSLTDANYDTTLATGKNWFPLLLGPVAGNSAANTITIQPAVGTSTLTYQGFPAGNGGNQTNATAITTASEPILGIIGTDYVTVRNLVLTSGGQLNTDRGLLVTNATATNGATNNLFENLTVSLARGNTSSIGIQQNTITAATNATGANSTNIYRNLNISNTYNGMYLLGTALFPDLDNQIGNSSPTAFNTIGSATANDLGGAAFATQCYGIRMGNQSNGKIFNNIVQNASTLSGTVDGILVELSQGTTEVYRNKVMAIRNAGTASTLNACGIRANLATTGAHVLRVYSNFVSGISSGYTGAGTATRVVKGIFVQAAGGGLVGETINVDFNSVSIDGTTFPNASNTCFEIGTSSGPVINTRNNIFANFTGAQTAPATHFTWRSTSATAVGNTGSVSNYNDLFLSNTTQGFTGQGNATNYATLLDWQTAMVGQDVNSISCDPLFIVQASDLHANSPCINAAGNATGITWATVDIDNEVLGSPADIGADEVANCSAVVGGTITPATFTRCQNQTYTMACTGATLGIGISYQWKVGVSSGGPFVNVVGGSGANSTAYTTGPLPAGTFYYVMTTTCSFGGATANSSELILTVNPSPIIGVTPGTSLICNPGGTPITLTATGGVSYTWSPTTNLTPSVGSPVVASPTATTTYVVTGTDAVGCTNTASATVTVGVGLSVNATATPSAICSGDTSVLSGVATFLSASYCQPTTSCTFPDIITNVTFSTINRTSVCDGAATGGYTSYATPNPVLTAGTSYALSVSTGGDTEGAAVWIDYNQDGIFSPSEQLLNGYLGTNPATYTNPAALIPLTAINGTTRMRVRCTYATNPNTLLDPACTNVTFGETEDYTVTIVGGADPFTYSWSPATFLSATNLATVNANTVTSSTTYVLTATSAAGCVATDTVALAVATAAIAAPTVVTPTCANTPVVINANATGGLPITYLWMPSGQSTATQTLTLAAGTYTDTLMISDNCAFTDTVTITYTVDTVPTIVVTPNAGAVCNPGGVAVTLNASGGSTYAWAPAAGLSATTGSTTDALPLASTSYVVTGTDGNGCISTDTAFVGVGLQVTAVADVTIDSICPASNTQLVGVGSSPVGTYCQPVYTNGTTFGDYISQVTLNTLTNATVGAAAPFYTLYPMAGTTTTTLTAGSTYTITLSPGTYTLNDLAAWIDYDQDGDMANAAEKLGETDNVAAAPATTAFTFTVPLTALNGVTRLRVRDVDHGGTNDMDPCLAQSTFGETEDYDITIVGGATAFSYSWSPSTFLASTTGDTVDVIGITANTSYVFTATASSGCFGLDTVLVTVFDTVAPTIVCPANDTVTVTTCVPMASWSPATGSDNCAIDTVTANINPGDPLSIGVNTITYTATDYLGLTATCTFDILVLDNPLAVTVSSAAGGTICAGDIDSLTANATGGVAPYTYAWSSGGAGMVEGVSPTSNITYTVTVTDSCGTSVTGTINMVVTPLPVAGFTFAPANPSAGQTVTFTNTSTGGTSSSWTFGDAGTSTNSNPTHVYITDGSFTVTLIETNSCGSDTATQTIPVALAIAQGLDGGSVAFFPNPNDGHFTMSLSNLEGKEVNVTITDMRGVMVAQHKLDVTSAEFREAMDLSNVTKGIYFVRVSVGENVLTGKITLQ
jgi:GEVED domain/Secretion system C-terminal sorting domain/HYR domain/PKD domain